VTKFNKIALLTLLLVPVFVTGCEVVGDIFRAGVWVGVIGVALFVALVVWIIGKLK
jgi:hypothetical protein